MVEAFGYDIVPFKSRSFFWITFRGEVGLGRLQRAHEAYVSHPDFVPGTDELLDFSATSLKQLDSEQIEAIRKYATSQPDTHNCKSAIVVGSKLEFGLTRMMGARLDRDVPVTRGVFYSLRDALEWLRPGEAEELLAAYPRALETGVG